MRLHWDAQPARAEQNAARKVPLDIATELAELRALAESTPDDVFGQADSAAAGRGSQGSEPSTAVRRKPQGLPPEVPTPPHAELSDSSQRTIERLQLQLTEALALADEYALKARAAEHRAELAQAQLTDQIIERQRLDRAAAQGGMAQGAVAQAQAGMIPDVSPRLDPDSNTAASVDLVSMARQRLVETCEIAAVQQEVVDSRSRRKRIWSVVAAVVLGGLTLLGLGQHAVSEQARTDEALARRERAWSALEQQYKQQNDELRRIISVAREELSAKTELLNQVGAEISTGRGR